MLRCTVPRLEAALGLEPLQLPCPHCGEPTLYPGYWCDDCGQCAVMNLDEDHEPNGDDEPDCDHVDYF
jgi:uncharacterized protein (DUF983 family)